MLRPRDGEHLHLGVAATNFYGSEPFDFIPAEARCGNWADADRCLKLLVNALKTRSCVHDGAEGGVVELAAAADVADNRGARFNADPRSAKSVRRDNSVLARSTIAMCDA